MNTVVQLGILFGLLVAVFILLNYLFSLDEPSVVQIVNGTVTGSHNMIYPGKKLLRSQNKQGGIELSYTWWMMVNSFDDSTGDEDIIFTKGDTSKNGVVYCPRVSLRQRGGENQMIVRVNTFNEQSESLIINNLPVKKWIHCSLVIQNEAISVYINGRIKESSPISGVIMQNYGDLGVGIAGGFSGLLSDLTYYTYAVNPSTMINSLRAGPNKTMVGVSNDYPPYFGDQWWVR